MTATFELSCLPQHREGSGEAKGAEGLLRGSRCPEPWYSSREPSVRSKQGSKERELPCGSHRTFPRSATRPWDDVHRAGPQNGTEQEKVRWERQQRKREGGCPTHPVPCYSSGRRDSTLGWMTPAELSTSLWCVHVCVCTLEYAMV